MKEKMSRSKIKVYIVLHLLLFLYAAGGICSKLAAKEAFLSPKFIMYYMIVLANLAFYAIVWQQIIKRISLVSAFANKAITDVGLFNIWRKYYDHKNNWCGHYYRRHLFCCIG